MPRPAVSSEHIRRRMQGQRRLDTKPELELRRELHRMGLRYQLQRRPVGGLRRTVDIVFPRERVAVEVRGCFWHGCPEHATAPKANAMWWKEKLEANRRRDEDTDRRLGEAGWHVIVVWEHEDPLEAAAAIAREVARRR